jgi:hypothetical protein
MECGQGKEFVYLYTYRSMRVCVCDFMLAVQLKYFLSFFAFLLPSLSCMNKQQQMYKLIIIFKIWSDRVIEEFFNQGDLEKKMGLPPTPNMDRETTKQAELSVNFVDFIVGPFFMALTSLLPKVHLCCELMRDNRAEWCRRIETDIQGRKNLSEEQKIEDITKWKRRELAFNEVVTPLIDQAKGKMVRL